MRCGLRMMAWVVAACVLGACELSPRPAVRDEDEAALFGPAAMRIHPIFTQASDWSGDGRLDGVEALIELQDQFGDPTKASGRVVFELFEFRPHTPQPRGERLAFWTGQLTTVQDQAQRWNRTSRTYGFQLAYDQMRADRTYVLTATFELSTGGRFFDEMILEPRERTGARESEEDRADAGERGG